MKEIEIIEVPMSEEDKIIRKFYREVRGEQEQKYYIGFKNNPKNQYSILFEDLKWLRKHFGVDRNEGSPITFDSLNESRKSELATYQKALDCNCPMWDLKHFDDNNKVLQYKNKNGDFVNYKITPLSKDGRKQFQCYIQNGFLVLCKLVDNVLN